MSEVPPQMNRTKFTRRPRNGEEAEIRTPRKIAPSTREATNAPAISPDPHAQVPSVSGETALFLLNLDSPDLTKNERTSDPHRASSLGL